MEGKRKYFVLVLFLLLALMIFAFANPITEDGKDFQDNSNDETEQVEKPEIIVDSEKEDNNNNNYVPVVRPVQPMQPVQNETTTENTQEDEIDTTYEDALAAVEYAEATYKAEDVEKAKELVNKVTDTTKKGELEDRLAEVEAGIEVMELIEELEYQVGKATEREDIVSAKDYRDENEVAKKLDTLTNEEVKEALKERLDKVNEYLDDETAPVVNIKDKDIFTEDVEITVEDENDVTITLTKDEQALEDTSKTSGDGIYTLTVIDKSFNETKVTFTVDGTKPVFNGLEDGKHYEEITIDVEDLTTTGIMISQDYQPEILIQNGTTIAIEGTFTLTATDEAGNSNTITVVVDKNAPTIERTSDVEYPTADEKVTIKDRYLNTVVVEGPEQEGTYTEFTVDENKENGTIEFTFTKEGTYKVTATDTIGNVTEETFTIDKTAPIINGFETNKYYYNTTIKPELIEANIESYTLNGEEYDGKEITEDGHYVLVATDKAGFTTTVKFAIDTTAPTITGIDKDFINKTVTPVIEDENLAYVTINKLPYIPGTPIFLYGKYELVAYDKAGNSTTVKFTLDNIKPKVLLLDRIEYISGKYLPIKPVILEQYIDTIVVKKNGVVIPYEKGQQLTDDATYEITVTDKAGNTETVTFTMDSVSPTAMVKPAQLGVVSKLDLNNLEVVDSLDDLNFALLNKDILLTEDAEFFLFKKNKDINVLDKNIPIYKPVAMSEDKVIDEEGEYYLVAYDKAYNVTAIAFTVDRSAPIINAKDGEFYKSLTLNVEDANLSSITVKKKGVSVGAIVENGYVIDKDGTYTITAKDIIGEKELEENYKEHITTVTIHIDTKTPTANVVEGGIYKKVTVNVKDEHLKSVTINGKEYDGKEIDEKGTYKLVAKDKANNKLEVEFEIDPTPITITGVTNKELYNTDKKVTVTARDENAKILLNGTETAKEFTVNKEGKHTIKVTDKWGNEESVTFTLDKTPATINNPFDGLNVEVGAAKDSSKEVEALVEDNHDADRYLKPTVKHSVKGNMGELSSIPTTADYVGEYTLTYNTKDAAGNISETLEVKVSVVIKDYVVKFVDVDNNNFKYTYGDAISPYKVTIYSAALGKNVDYEAKDVTFSVEGNKTLKYVGTYKVTATVNGTKFPGVTAESQVFTIVQKEVEVAFTKTNGTTTLDQYEYDGKKDPFTATITSGLINDDTATVEVTYDTTTFDAGSQYTATANIIDNNNYKVKNADYNFKVTKATATVVINSKDDIQITNNEGKEIEESVKINTITDVATGTAKGGIAYGKYEIKQEKKYNVGFTIIDVVSTNTNNVTIETVPTKGVESLDNITQSLNNIKSSIESNSVYKIIKRLAPELSITLEEDVTDNLNKKIVEVETKGYSKLFVDTPIEVK